MLVGTRTADVFHGEGEKLDAIIREAGTGELVHWTGFVPDENLVPLASGAVASLLPSECEGFGLPAVEAAACGTPVIATTESPLPELLEGGGIFVRPGDLDVLQAAMRRMLREPEARHAMAQCALQRARALSWERGAAVVRRRLPRPWRLTACPRAADLIARKPSKQTHFITDMMSVNPARRSRPRLPSVEKGSSTPFRLAVLFRISSALNPLRALKSL